MGTQTSLTIVSLSTLLENQEIDKEQIQCSLSSFCPVYEHEDIRRFLDHSAITQEEQKISRTYLWLDDDALAVKELKVLGFFAIALKVFTFDPDTPEKKRKRITKNPNPETNSFCAAYLIGQISRSKDTPKGSGYELMQRVLMKIKEAQAIVGGSFVYLDCHDDETVKANYQKSGFKELQKKQDGSGDVQMWLHL